MRDNGFFDRKQKFVSRVSLQALNDAVVAVGKLPSPYYIIEKRFLSCIFYSIKQRNQSQHMPLLFCGTWLNLPLWRSMILA